MSLLTLLVNGRVLHYTIVNRDILSPSRNGNPTLFAIPCKIFGLL